MLPILTDFLYFLISLLSPSIFCINHLLHEVTDIKRSHCLQTLFLVFFLKLFSCLKQSIIIDVLWITLRLFAGKP